MTKLMSISSLVILLGTCLTLEAKGEDTLPAAVKPPMDRLLPVKLKCKNPDKVRCKPCKKSVISWQDRLNEFSRKAIYEDALAQTNGKATIAKIEARNSSATQQSAQQDVADMKSEANKTIDERQKIAGDLAGKFSSCYVKLHDVCRGKKIGKKNKKRAKEARLACKMGLKDLNLIAGKYAVEDPNLSDDDGEDDPDDNGEDDGEDDGTEQDEKNNLPQFDITEDDSGLSTVATNSPYLDSAYRNPSSQSSGSNADSENNTPYGAPSSGTIADGGSAGTGSGTGSGSGSGASGSGHSLPPGWGKLQSPDGDSDGDVVANPSSGSSTSPTGKGLGELNFGTSANSSKGGDSKDYDRDDDISSSDNPPDEQADIAGVSSDGNKTIFAILHRRVQKITGTGIFHSTILDGPKE